MLNKTPKSNVEKTVLALNKRILLIFGVILLVCVLILLISQSSDFLTIKDQTIKIETVRSPASVVRGLSGRNQLPENEGMFFIMDRDAKHCFWMKDMQFPLDIIWLNSQKQIIHIEANVTPDSFPKSFCPNEPARYVLEINAGKAAKWGWSVGQKATF